MLFWVTFIPPRPDFHATMTPEEQALVVLHLESLAALQEAKKVQFAGRADDKSHGLAIFDVESEAEMEAILAENPACKAGLFRAESKPYRLPRNSEPPK
jgi:uncharacterized protein YciI